MASFNRVIIMGNLTRDPDRKQLPTGQSVCRLGIASNRQYKNKQTGAMVQEVCFVDVDVWGPQADSCQQYLQKGKSVLVEGRLKLDSWEDNGVKRNKHYIVAERVTFLGAASASSEDSDEASDSFSGAESSEPVAPVKRKARETKAKESFGFSATENTTSIGEIEFKNEEPFGDELPF